MKCQYCEKTFSTKKSLKVHQKTATFCLKLQNKNLNDYLILECKVCFKKFSLITNLKRHETNCSKKKSNDDLEKLLKKERECENENKVLNNELTILKTEHENILEIKNKDIEITKLNFKLLENENIVLLEKIERCNNMNYELQKLIENKDSEIENILGSHPDFKDIKKKYDEKILILSNKVKKRICEHNKRIDICIDCDGASICKHKKIKSICKECGGSALCKTPLCELRKNKKYDGYCLRCFIYMYPDKPVVRNYKTKEKSVVDYVLSNFEKEKYDWICDKKVQDGCSSKRPDMILDLGYNVIVIEIDENQHKSYDTSCENSRLMTISKDIGHRPMVLIRFNPDSYTNEYGKYIESCWTLNNLGICIIKKDKENEWKERLNSIKTLVEFYLNINNKIEQTIKVENLYYDC